jgi:PII-like signaling protein
MTASKMLEVHCSEGDRYEDKPLHEAIVERCRALRIAGATVLRGLEGYGETSTIHRRRLLERDSPVTVLVVDSPAQIQALALEIEQMMDKGMMAISDVSVRRVER